LASRLGERLQGLFWNGQPERSNSVIGPYWQHFAGEPAVCEDFRGVKLFYPPGAFGQSHLELAEAIAERVADHVPEGAHVAEFYAGVGAIGLPLAERCASLVLNELGQDSLSGLASGIAELPTATRERISVLPGDAGGAAAAVEQRGVVIVDPPRKGIDSELLAKLVAHPPARLLYVSCGLPSLVEQAKTLEQSFCLTALEPFALFPYTEHVETLAVFDRR
jgi:23S rRNA (uracil1939-C5)-methyltransferase